MLPNLDGDVWVWRRMTRFVKKKTVRTHMFYLILPCIYYTCIRIMVQYTADRYGRP
jgi:hypothetical protein